MSRPAAVPISEFVEHLNMPSDTAELAEVQRHLLAATGVAEGMVGPIVNRTVTARLTVRGGASILSDAPIQSITSLTGLHGAPSYAGDVLDVDPDTGVVTHATSCLTDGSYTAEYVAGRAETAEEVEQDLRTAVCIIGKHLWETQRGRGGQNRGGLLATSTPADEKVPLGFLIPHRARSLLEPYEPLPVA